MSEGTKDYAINISGTGGDVFGVGISGSGNIFTNKPRVNLNNNQLSIDPHILSKINEQYANALQEFTNKVNEEITKNQIPTEKILPVQESINELAKETEGIIPGVSPSFTKNENWRSKFIAVSKHVLKVLPKTGETFAAFTPLAPFKELIREGLDHFVKGIQGEV
jgi:hypothetical protein